MSYQKHNFEAGAVLFASQLNDMDNQIEFLSNQGSSFSDNFKTALLNCFENVAWINENGQTCYDALYDSLYPDNMWFITNILTGCVTSNNATNILKNNSYVATITANEGYTLDGATVSITIGGNDVTNLYYSSGSINIPNVTGDLVITVLASSAVASISAVFTQGSATIYDTDSLDTLKQYLTVTVNYADSTTETVTDYTLSGTLTAGTSTVTVSYGGKTTTFDAVVTETLPSGYTHLDYVTANGTQYIQTNLTESDLRYCGYEVKASSTGTTNGNGHLLSSANMFFTRLCYQSGRWYSTKRFGNESGTSAGGSIDQWVVGTVYVLEAFKNGSNLVSINGIPYRYFTPGSDYTASNKFAIFAYGGSVSTTKYRFHGNFYYMKLENTDGELIHYFVPCKNASNVVGLYDVIDGVFYPPTAGTLVGA